MIKIKIYNPLEGKNRISFLGFLMLKDVLKDYSIEITDSEDYDYAFLGANDILNKGIGLQESIDYGLESCNKITGDYFIFDGSDSTSLMGAYEVLEQSDAKFLFKNQLLQNREDYKIPTSFNKWFFGNGSDLDLGYDISEENWKKIKLSGWNLGYMIGNGFRPSLDTLQPISQNKNVDLCAIYMALHPHCQDHFARNDTYYTKHRNGAWNVIGDNPGYSYVKDKLPFEEYMRTLHQSRLSLSPFGMGEVCYRDFEIMDMGVAMIKPNMAKVKTSPNYYIPEETYISVNPDWSDLNEVVLDTLQQSDKIEYIVETSRKKYKELYSAHTFCMHWYNIFSNLNGVINE